MGKEKYQDKIINLFEKSPVVDYSSIKRIINNPEYAKQLIRNLVLKKKIKKLTKGFYTKHDEPSLIVFCFKPSYLGLQDSLSMHNLWEQETIPVVITSKKIGKAPLLEIEKQTESFIKELIRKAARNSSFSGRNTLKPKDFD